MTKLINLLAVIVLFCTSAYGNRGNEMSFTVQLSEVEPFMAVSIGEADSTFTKVMNEVMQEKQQYPDSSIVDLFYYYCKKQYPQISINHFFHNYELSDYVDYQSDDSTRWITDNEGIRKGLKEYIINAWRNTYFVIRQRIDYSSNGVVTIKHDKDGELSEALFYAFPKKQKIFKLHGVENFERIKKLLYTKGSFGVYEVNQDTGSSINMNDLKLQKGGGGVFNDDDLKNAKKIKRGKSQEIEIEFDPTSQAKLYRLTSNNIGKRIAIVIDDEILATLVIDEIISDGKLVIPVPTLTENEIKDLIAILKSGCLQTSIRITNEQIVNN